jgi:hypothetical protein
MEKLPYRIGRRAMAEMGGNIIWIEAVLQIFTPK